MWDAGSEYEQIIAGDHQIDVSLSAWRGDEQTAELTLAVGDAEREDEFDGSDVRRTIRGLAVQDPDGALTPRRITDPLAPFGQSVVVMSTLTAGPVSATIPYGEFLVTEPESTSGWRPWRDTWIPTGGTITFDALDRWEVVARSTLAGLWQASGTATVQSEVRRLMRGILSIADDAIPAATIPASKRVHSEDNAEAIRSLLAIADRVPHVDRSGIFSPLPTRPTADRWDITVNEQAGIGAIPTLTDEGVYNVVEVTGESDDADSEIRAVAVEEGHLAPGPLFGWRQYGHHDPLYKTGQAARAGARTRLANLTRERALVFTVTTRFDPARDVLDPCRLTVTPSNPRVPAVTMLGTVTRIKHPLTGGAMTVDVAVPWREAGVYE